MEGVNSLGTVVTKELPEELQNIIVKDLVDSDGQWRWDILQEFLPLSIPVKVASICPPKDDAPPDYVLWSGSSSGEFTVKEAYNKLEEENWSERDSLWKKVWQWGGPQRIKNFL